MLLVLMVLVLSDVRDPNPAANNWLKVTNCDNARHCLRRDVVRGRLEFCTFLDRIGDQGTQVTGFLLNQLKRRNALADG
jgi:hypothetical protein